MSRLRLPTPKRVVTGAQYPNQYTWFVFLSAMDLMLTWIILHFGGREVNWFADRAIGRWDIGGAVIFKFLLVVLVIVVCEAVGRQRRRIGQALATFAVALTAVPVVWALYLLLRDRFG